MKETKQMKKLMVMAAVAMAALCSQAVAFSWSGSSVIDSAGNDYLAAGEQVYLFASGLTRDGSALVSDATVTAALVLGSVNDGNFLDTYASKAVGATGIVGAEGGFEGSVLNLSGKSAGDVVSMFAVIVDTKGSPDTMAIYIPGTQGAADTKFNNTTGMAQWKMGELMDTTYGGAWVAQSVPEPTSGLLLLLGVAGLALRRRRA